jgi:hypothetical protein
MNTKQIRTLNSLLKRHDVKDVTNTVRYGMGINWDKLMRDTEPLYVMSRIISCYDADKRNGMKEAHKEWIADVVRYGWIDALNDYIKQSGAEVVTQAIYYLMDNNLWRSYDGRLGLGQQGSEKYYEGLSDLPAAIAKVLELHPELAPKQEEPKATEAQKAVVSAASEADAAIESLIDKIHIITDYVKNNVDTGGSSQQTELMKKRIEEQKKVISELKKQLENRDAVIGEQSSRIAKMEQNEKEQDGYYKELHDKYNTLLDERDAISKENDTYAKMLEEAAQKEQMPKRKVIPESVLLDVPLLGRGVLKGLKSTLERYNIFINPNV